MISGLYEPTDAECEWESDDEKVDELSAALKKKAQLDANGEAQNKTDE